MTLPPDIIAFCQRHPGCKGCSLGTCNAPLVNADSQQWKEWIESKITEIREINAPKR